MINKLWYNIAYYKIRESSFKLIEIDASYETEKYSACTDNQLNFRRKTKKSSQKFEVNENS